jgi:uncharacterized protein
MATKKKAKAKSTKALKARTGKKSTPPKNLKKSTPPKNLTKSARPGVVHWEVQAKNPAKQQQFFASLFGWAIDANNPQNYGMVASGGRDAINGGIGAAEDQQPRVTVYVQVADIDAILAKAETLGGRTIMPRTDIGMVVMGQFRDPEGNIIGVVEG